VLWWKEKRRDAERIVKARHRLDASLNREDD